MTQKSLVGRGGGDGLFAYSDASDVRALDYAAAQC